MMGLRMAGMLERDFRESPQYRCVGPTNPCPGGLDPDTVAGCIIREHRVAFRLQPAIGHRPNPFRSCTMAHLSPTAPRLSRRSLLVGAALGAVTAATSALAARPQPLIEVWKTPTCGCCAVWVRHVEEAGFRVRVTDMPNVDAIKRQLNVRPEHSSCHTARVGGYVVEGHVPAEDIIRLLEEKPAIRGIFVPGMPIGSPGMEGPDADSYDVLAVDRAGAVSVFATHGP